MRTPNFSRTLQSCLLASAFIGSAHALDLTGVGYYTYGNTNSYSLPIAAYQNDLVNGGGVGPGSPYYIGSSPGQIQDLVVIYTGSAGTGVTTNVQGFEDAYQTPNGSSPIYATTQGTGVISPTGTDTKGIQTIYSTTWDANLLAMKGFLAGGDPVFLFNNNETNGDQSLAIWAKLWITDANGAVYNNRYLYLANSDGTATGLAQYGQGGIPLGDATVYNPGDVQPGWNLLDGTTDYAMSGGNVCVSRATGQVPADQNLCNTDPQNYENINHNLGANQVAYAGTLPLLDQYLQTLFALSDANLGLYSLHLQLNLGCNPAQLPVTNQGNCQFNDIGIDNGFEQLFLASTNTIFVPEPGSLALLGLALATLGVVRRRRNA